MYVVRAMAHAIRSHLQLARVAAQGAIRSTEPSQLGISDMRVKTDITGVDTAECLETINRLVIKVCAPTHFCVIFPPFRGSARLVFSFRRPLLMCSVTRLSTGLSV